MDADKNREFATDVVRKLTAAGYEALWAGGCVRDLLLGRTPKDFDVATNARPEHVRELFGRRKTLAVGASFGVIVVVAPRGVEHVEVATFRSEGPYTDGRRPEHVVFTTAEEDAQRRDFTINGMFYDPLQQRVQDFVGGEHDLSAGVLRAIGDPHARMEEDKLRMLRAVRFAATLDFELDEHTANAVRAMAGELSVVSAERIAQELRRLLTDPHRRRGVELLRETQLLPVIFPELAASAGEPAGTAWQRTLQRLHLLRDPDFSLATAAFWFSVCDEDRPADLPAKMGRRLKLSNQEIASITGLCQRAHALDNADQLPLCRLKRLLAAEDIDALLAFVRVRLLAEEADLHPVLFCEEYLRSTPPEEIDPPPLLTGQDLIRHGLRPGKAFKSLLDIVRDAQLDGTIHTAAEAMTLVEQRLQRDL